MAFTKKVVPLVTLFSAVFCRWKAIWIPKSRAIKEYLTHSCLCRMIHFTANCVAFVISSTDFIGYLKDLKSHWNGVLETVIPCRRHGPTWQHSQVIVLKIALSSSETCYLQLFTQIQLSNVVIASYKASCFLITETLYICYKEVEENMVLSTKK